MAVTTSTPRTGLRPAATPHSPAARSLCPGRDVGTRQLTPVPYQRPQLPSLAAIQAYYERAESARWFSNGGPCATLLAERVGQDLRSDQHGTPDVVPVANCTLGLVAALRATCGEAVPGVRDRIVLPAFTFTASACAVAWAGFTPLFVDVDPDAWQLDPTELDRVLDEQDGRVAGVLGCTTFGTAPPDATRAAWRASCDRHGIPLVIDSAAGFGATDASGRRLGALGDIEVFSLHATKPSAAGEGGLIVCSDPDLAARLTRLVNFGIDPATRTSATIGLNAKLSELHAASALAMLDHLDYHLRRRRARVDAARATLDRLPVSWQQHSEGSTWQVLQLLMPDSRTRVAALDAAKELAVEARTCFDPPLHRHPAFAETCVLGGDLRVTEHLAARALSLPMANDLAAWEISRITAVVERACAA